MGKEFRTLKEQTEILKNRNMNISDGDEELLLQFNYGYIIYNYSEIFINPTTKLYWDDTRLSDVIGFWKFERQIMSWIMPYIYKFEHIFKSCLAYLIAKEGLNSHYEDEIYSSEEIKIKSIIITKKNLLAKELIYIKKEGYENLVNHKVPIWLLVNELTFNDLINFFSCLNEKIQKDFLSKVKYKGKRKKFSHYCKIIKEYRNRESHNGVIHNPFRLKYGTTCFFLNDCINALARIKENVSIKEEISYKFYDEYSMNDYNKELIWLNNNYKIHINNELEKIKNKNNNDNKIDNFIGHDNNFELAGNIRTIKEKINIDDHEGEKNA